MWLSNMRLVDGTERSNPGIELTEWRKNMMTSSNGKFYASLALCEGNPQIICGFSSQRSKTRSFNFFLWSAPEQRFLQTIETPLMRRYRTHYDATVISHSFRWFHNDHGGVSNHQPRGCLLNCLFRCRWKKTSKLRVTGLCAGNSPGPVNSPHKWPVTRKMFPFDDVIMLWQLLCSTDADIKYVHRYDARRPPKFLFLFMAEEELSQWEEKVHLLHFVSYYSIAFINRQKKGPGRPGYIIGMKMPIHKQMLFYVHII